MNSVFTYLPLPLFLILLGVAFVLGDNGESGALPLDTQARDIEYRYRNGDGDRVLVRAATATALPDGALRIDDLNLIFDGAARAMSFDGDSGAVDSARRALTMQSVNGWVRSADVQIALSLSEMAYDLADANISGRDVLLRRGDNVVIGDAFFMNADEIVLEGQVRATYAGLQ